MRHEALWAQSRFQVWNAWMGPETRTTLKNRPWLTFVSWRLENEPLVVRQLHRWGYFKVHEDFARGNSEWALWPIWPFLKVRDAWWHVYRYGVIDLYRAGVIHIDCPENVVWSWRDIRFGPE